MISATIRDIAIIIVAVETIIISGLLIVLIWQVWRLVKMVQTEIKPILQDTQATVGTVRGTADFVGNNVVNPVVRTSGRIAGFRQTVRTLQAEIRGPGRRRPTPPPPPPSTAAESTAPPPPSPAQTIETP